MSIVHGGWCDTQVFQHGKLVVHGLDDLLQTRNRHPKAYALHAITVLEGNHYSCFVLCGEILIFVIEVDDEGKGRGMC